jgi:O-antigen ligase
LLAHSRAGIALTIVALLGAFAVAVLTRGPAGQNVSRLLIAAGVGALVLSTQYALYRAMERFAEDPLKDARITFAETTWRAAKAFMPTGSGLGTFVPVFASLERPQDLLVDAFANRAHNDVLEIALETGAVGLLLGLLFALWLASRFAAAWWRSSDEFSPIDVGLMRASTLAIGLLLLHSLVDYPLRTTAMLTVFAFCCALLLPAAKELQVENTMPQREARDLEAHVPLGPQKPATPTIETSPIAKSEPWGKDIEWPEAWRSPPKPPRGGRG